MTAITPVSQYDGVALARSAAGERMMMEGGSTPLATLLQKLVDRTEFAKDAVIGNISWSGDFSVSGTAPNSFTVTVGAINAAVLLLSSTYKVFASSGGTPGQTKVEGGGGTLTAAAQWWYVYAYSNAGTLDYEISTTAPGASRMFKTGDFTRAYLGCFRTLSTGVPITMRASRGRYLYRSGAQALADTRVLDAGVQTVATTVSCASLVPPHARLATLRGHIVPTAAALGTCVVRTTADAGADSFSWGSPATTGATAAAAWDQELDSSQRLDYVVSSANHPTTIWVQGFYE